MRMKMLAASLLLYHLSFAQPFQLAPPLLQYSSTFSAKGTSSLSILFNQPGAEVRYTLNGKEPTAADKLYTTPITIKGSRVMLKARAMGKGFLPSETVQAQFIQGGLAIASVNFTPPHESYAKSSADILHDNAGGLTRYGSGTWLGYDRDTVQLDIELRKTERVQRVLLDLLQDENSWIFLPERITLSYWEKKSQAYVPVIETRIDHSKAQPKQCVLKELILPTPVNTRKLRVQIETVKSIPGWHAAKGSHAWFFIDEIKVF